MFSKMYSQELFCWCDKFWHDLVPWVGPASEDNSRGHAAVQKIRTGISVSLTFTLCMTRLNFFRGNSSCVLQKQPKRKFCSQKVSYQYCFTVDGREKMNNLCFRIGHNFLEYIFYSNAKTLLMNRSTYTSTWSLPPSWAAGRSWWRNLTTQTSIDRVTT